jgi:hypothetical protein
MIFFIRDSVFQTFLFPSEAILEKVILSGVELIQKPLMKLILLICLNIYYESFSSQL